MISGNHLETMNENLLVLYSSVIFDSMNEIFRGWERYYARQYTYLPIDKGKSLLLLPY